MEISLTMEMSLAMEMSLESLEHDGHQIVVCSLADTSYLCHTLGEVTLLVKLRWKLFSLAVIFVSYHLRRVSVLSPVYLESMIGTAK